MVPPDAGPASHKMMQAFSASALHKQKLNALRQAIQTEAETAIVICHSWISSRIWKVKAWNGWQFHVHFLFVLAFLSERGAGILMVTGSSCK